MPGPEPIGIPSVGIAIQAPRYGAVLVSPTAGARITVSCTGIKGGVRG